MLKIRKLKNIADSLNPQSRLPLVKLALHSWSTEEWFFYFPLISEYIQPRNICGVIISGSFSKAVKKPHLFIIYIYKERKQANIDPYIGTQFLFWKASENSSSLGYS